MLSTLRFKSRCTAAGILLGLAGVLALPVAAQSGGAGGATPRAATAAPATGTPAATAAPSTGVPASPKAAAASGASAASGAAATGGASGAAPAGGAPDPAHVKEDIARHRTISAAHATAAKCLEGGRSEKDCHAELRNACQGIAVGRYCGMRHSH